MRLADILEAVAAAEREALAKWEALPDDIKNHHWIAKPEITQNRVYSPHWSMSKVVTGNRRKWSKPTF